MVIAHNLAAMNTQRQYGMVSASQKKSSERLSSGYRINRAADDAAGLTISEKMRSQIRGLNQGSDNIQDGISLIQIADGALSEINDMLHRMTELSVKSANGTNTTADRTAIQHEVQALTREIDRIGKSTEFNTMPILDDAKGDTPVKVTELVKCGAAEFGKLTDAYQDTSGKWHSAAVLDMSGLDSRTVNALNGTYFSFTCSASCDEAFKIAFNYGLGNSSSDLQGSVTHNYSVDIKGCKNGEDVINRVMSYVGAHPSQKTPGVNNTGSVPGALGVSHSNSLVKDGSKLVILSNATSPDEATAKTKWANNKSKYGAVDCTTMSSIKNYDLVNSFAIQCSSSRDDSLVIETHRVNSDVLGIKHLNISTQDNAKEALAVIEDAGALVSSYRSELGAFQNRLEHSFNNNENKAENTTAAESRIRDTDMAEEMVRFSTSNILAQAGQSMMAQANQSTSGILSLLS